MIDRVADDVGSPKDFARTFGDTLNDFLQQKGIRQTDVAKQLGITKARLNTYCHDSKAGKRAKPDAEILYLVCTKLVGFNFEYNGFRISAETLNGRKRTPAAIETEQLTLRFDRQFNLTDEQGTVKVHIRRPPGGIAVSVTLQATGS
jgi:transcriptional regulator with XRE-family HTH domain